MKPSFQFQEESCEIYSASFRGIITITQDVVAGRVVAQEPRRDHFQ
jgi:hypothetical protein